MGIRYHVGYLRKRVTQTEIKNAEARPAEEQVENRTTTADRAVDSENHTIYKHPVQGQLQTSHNNRTAI
jgi:hypothetical protein